VISRITAPNADLLVEDYQYLEPPDEDDIATVAEYDAFLEERYDELQGVARLYGQILQTVGGDPDGTAPWMLGHWERYLDAASTVHRVRSELRAYDQLEDEPQHEQEHGYGEDTRVTR
jgi:hypothetical protein